MKTTCTTIILLLLSSCSVSAQANWLDQSFSEDGYLLANFMDGFNSTADQVVVQPDGKILVGINVSLPGGEKYVVVTRYLPDGSIDTGFNIGGRILVKEPDQEINLVDMLLLPDGRIMIGVNILEAGNFLYQTALFQFYSDGTRDIDFGPNGMVETNHAGYISTKYVALDRSPDGKIVATGHAIDENGVQAIAAFRYLPNGVPDQVFHGNGLASVVTTPTMLVWEVAVQPDAKIILAGFTDGNMLSIRFNPEGTLDTGFGNGGIAVFMLSDLGEAATGLAVQADGKILLGGYINFLTPGNTSDFMVMRLLTNGAPDPSFGNEGVATMDVSTGNDLARTLLLQPDGNILLGGYSTDSSGIANFAVARFTADGAPDDHFGENGKIIFPVTPGRSIVYCLALQPDGKIIAAGRATPFGSTLYAAVARIFPDGVIGAIDIPAIFSDILIYPNPTQHRVQLEYNLQESTMLAINLYDMQGGLLQNLLAPILKGAGAQRETLYLNNRLAAGTYLLSIETGSGKKQMQVIVKY